MTQVARYFAEFDSAEQVLHAARKLRESGYDDLDAFTPFPLPELEETLGMKRPRLIPACVAAAACLGGSLAFLVIWWTAAVSYPLDVGGRPLNSFVADIPILFESSVLAASLTAFASTLLLSGMPRLHHPLEALPGFERTTNNRFWLGVKQPLSHQAELLETLRELGARRVQPFEATRAE